jgi:protein-disulfide isomerase
MEKDDNELSSGILIAYRHDKGGNVSRFWIILAIVIVGLGGLFIATKPKESLNSTFTGDAKVVQEDDHVRGNRNAKVVLIEYGDLQCPACGSYYPVIKSLEEKFKDDVAFVFRHFPLISIHPNAFSASRAAEAAGNQGKFWEMHDKLFETQNSWGQVATNQQSLFEAYATDLDLNLEQFRTDYASSQVADRINRDIASAKEFDARSTPTFVLNGKKIDNPNGQEEFAKLLEDAIKEASQSQEENNTEDTE